MALQEEKNEAAKVLLRHGISVKVIDKVCMCMTIPFTLLDCSLLGLEWYLCMLLSSLYLEPNDYADTSSNPQGYFFPGRSIVANFFFLIITAIDVSINLTKPPATLRAWGVGYSDLLCVGNISFDVIHVKIFCGIKFCCLGCP